MAEGRSCGGEIKEVRKEGREEDNLVISNSSCWPKELASHIIKNGNVVATSSLQ
jgi:hypothetical protein